MKELELFDNIQFIYELALAKLELSSFNVDFEETDNLRIFKLNSIKNIENLKKRLAYFKKINGELTDYYYLIKQNQTRSVNQYLTHWFYPYKGKFHPQMIRALLNIAQVKSGETVLDPFVGSGTTLLECQLMGINSIGIDISPVCVLISKVKTESIDILDKIEKIKDDILKTNKSKSTLTSFVGSSENLETVIESIKDEKARNFFNLAKLIAHSDLSRRGKNFALSFNDNVEKMLKSVKDFKDIVEKLNLKLGNIKTEKGDVRELKLKDESIDCIITSPPYSIALDYVKNDKHSLKALGYDIAKIREKFIGMRGKNAERIQLYNADMKKSIEEMARVLKPNKYCIIVIGNATYQGEEVPTVQTIIYYCKKAGLKLEKNIDKIIYGLYNVMQKENILIFKKS